MVALFLWQQRLVCVKDYLACLPILDSCLTTAKLLDKRPQKEQASKGVPSLSGDNCLAKQSLFGLRNIVWDINFFERRTASNRQLPTSTFYEKGNRGRFTCLTLVRQHEHLKKGRR